jgi:hypothetical protein
MKMRTNRNAWGMKFKAAGSGMIAIQGIGNYWFCKTTTPKK